MKDATAHSVPAVVLGVETDTGLSIVRSLSYQGVPVVGVAVLPNSYTLRTRHLTKVYYSRDKSPENLLSVLEQVYFDLRRKSVLFASSDTHVVMLSEEKERLENMFFYPAADPKDTMNLLDKWLISENISKYNIGVPSSICFTSDEILSRKLDTLQFPVVLKPALRDVEWDLKSNQKVFLVQTLDGLKSRVKSYSNFCNRWIAQEWITGEDSDIYFVLLYIKSKKVLGAFSGRKIRQWPCRIGSTSLAIDYYDEEVFRLSEEILLGMGATGFCSLELKKDKKRDSWAIIEPTIGRVNLQSYMSVSAGINFPYIGYLDMLGLSVSSAIKESRHVCWMREIEDIYSAREYLKNGRLTYLSWLKTIYRINSFAVFDFWDLGPGIWLIKDKVSSLFSKHGD